MTDRERELEQALRDLLWAVNVILGNQRAPDTETDAAIHRARVILNA